MITEEYGLKRYKSLKSARKSIIMQVVCLSVIVLILCFGAWISGRGRVTLNLILAYNDEAMQTADLVIDWEDEAIPVSDYEVVHIREGESDEAFLRITLMPEKAGHYILYASNKNGEIITQDKITVGRFLTTFSWVSGDFTGSRLILFLVFVYQIGLFLIMFTAFLRLEGPLANSCEAIFTCGVMIFFGVILCFAIPYYIRYLHNPVSYPVWELVLNFASAGRTIMSLTRIGLLIFSILLIISNIALLRHENPRFQNVLGILLGLILTGVVLAEYLIFRKLLWQDDPPQSLKAIIIAANTVGLTFAYVECILTSTVVCGLRAARHVPEMDRDYILILGCGFRRDGTLTPLLKGRVDKALEFWRMQKKETGKEAFILPSGGQGRNEPMAEAKAMCNYIRQTDIPEEFVIPEDRSVNTYQNMLFCKNIIDGREPDSSRAKVCYVTTNYHVFRSGILANRVGLTGEGLGAKTKWWFWPNAYIRECIGFFSNRKLLILYLAVLASIAAAIIQLTNLMF